MNIITTLLCLLFVQAPAPKPLWSNTKVSLVQLLATTPDGKTLYTLNRKVEADKSIKMMVHQWEVATGKELDHYALEEIDKPEFSTVETDWKVERFDASPDGKTLIVSMEVPFSSNRKNIYGYRNLQLYDLATGKRRGNLINKVICFHPGQFAAESRSCFSPDGKWFWVVSVGFGEQIDIYSSATGQLETSIKMTPNVRSPQDVAFSEDGTRAAVFYQGSNNRYSVVVYSWPGVKPVTEFQLPAEHIWQGMHSWQGSKVCLEAMVEADESKKNVQAATPFPMPHPIQAWKRVCHSIDIAAAAPMSTLKQEPLLAGFRGESLGMPSIFWDAGPTWIASFTQHQLTEKLIQTAAGKNPALAYYYWRDVKVMDNKTGKPLWEHKGMPYQSHVTRDGRYLIAVGASPDLADGIRVWELAK